MSCETSETSVGSRHRHSTWVSTQTTARPRRSLPARCTPKQRPQRGEKRTGRQTEVGVTLKSFKYNHHLLNNVRHRQPVQLSHRVKRIINYFCKTTSERAVRARSPGFSRGRYAPRPLQPPRPRRPRAARRYWRRHVPACVCVDDRSRASRVAGDTQLSAYRSVAPSLYRPKARLRVGRGVHRLEVGGERAVRRELELRAVGRQQRAPLGRVDGGVRRVALAPGRYGEIRGDVGRYEGDVGETWERYRAAGCART